MRDGISHYVRHNASSRIPDRYVILDTEAHRSKTKNGEVQTWALAVANFIVFTRQGTIKQERLRFDTPAALWQYVSQFTRPKRRTVLYAHNLNYDLRISLSLSSLTEIGWILQDMRLDGRGSWSRWSHQSASLLLCDSASIFPVKLEKLAIELGMSKLPLPRSDQREALYRRCERDVDILSLAIVEYVKWLKTGVCGNWQMTGASQSWAHFRHSLMPYPILVHNDDMALEAERAAMHTGRCEAWRWGPIKNEKVWEYDWSNSYPRIALDTGLPQALFGSTTSLSVDSLDRICRRFCVLAQVTVKTDTACVPTTYQDRTLWPVGQFDTCLWDPEIRLLRDSGATIQVHRAWFYKRAPILKDWAEWILSSLYDQTGNVEQWKKLILKHWSRSLIGRFGMRYRAWEYYADAPYSHIGISMFHDSDTGLTSELLQIGTKVFKLSDYQEVNDGCPQVTSYIMSEARAKLWRVSLQIGQHNVYYMDTDSLIVNQRGSIAISKLSQSVDFAGLRSKSTTTNGHIYGPRSIVLGGKPSVSGMAKNSIKMEPHKWQSEYWRGCQESIARKEYDRVTILLRSFTLRYNEHRRAFSDDYTTVPYRLPDYIPDASYIRPNTRLQRAILNGYPAMLSRSTKIAPTIRPKGPKNSTANLQRMRT